MKMHELKIKAVYFSEIAQEKKTFELRQNDRDYRVGDVIHFHVIDGNRELQSFADRFIYRITYVLENVPEYGLANGYAILAIQKAYRLSPGK